MTVYYFSSAKKTGLGLDAKSEKLVQLLPLSNLGKHNPSPGELSYIDISGCSEKEAAKLINTLKRRCPRSPWGIADPKGILQDPAEWFFSGASDYIGRKLFQSGISGKRFAAVLSYYSGPAAKKPAADVFQPEARKVKLPPGKFSGWNTIGTGEVCPFFFLYVSLEGKSNLRSRLGENGFSLLKTRQRNLLQQKLSGTDALLWIETERDFLFLIPPKLPQVKAAVTACLKILISTPLVISEHFGLVNIPADFRFALHYGKTPFRAPGKTGTIVSEAVNFIFHLGTKFAAPGRISISGDVPDESVPDELKDMFAGAGTFEDHVIIHSKKFLHSR